MDLTYVRHQRFFVHKRETRRARGERARRMANTPHTHSHTGVHFLCCSEKHATNLRVRTCFSGSDPHPPLPATTTATARHRMVVFHLWTTTKGMKEVHYRKRSNYLGQVRQLLQHSSDDIGGRQGEGVLAEVHRRDGNRVPAGESLR